MVHEMQVLDEAYAIDVTRVPNPTLEIHEVLGPTHHHRPEGRRSDHPILPQDWYG